MLLCLSNIGDAMAHSFKFIYWKVCCYLCIKPQKKSRSSFRHRSRYLSGRSPLRDISKTTQETHLDTLSRSSYYTAPGTVMSDSDSRSPTSPLSSPTVPASPSSVTAGSPQYSAPTNVTSTQQALYQNQLTPCRNPVISNKYVIHSREDIPVDLAHPSIGHLDSSYNLPRGNLHQPEQCNWGRQEDTLEFDVEEEENECDSEENGNEEEVSVPIWLCSAIVIGYICGGAFLFTIWEDWNFLDSSYFCFITLTTIGFGDLVPGTAVLSEDAQLTLGLCALYLLFGMALLAMSFNLVQEEFTKSVKCIGRRIGILSDNEDDN